MNCLILLHQQLKVSAIDTIMSLSLKHFIVSTTTMSDDDGLHDDDDDDVGGSNNSSSNNNNNNKRHNRNHFNSTSNELFSTDQPCQCAVSVCYLRDCLCLHD